MPHVHPARAIAGAAVAVALATFVPGSPHAGRAEAASTVLWLQGPFCNTEAQIDQVLALIAQGSHPRTAVELTNAGTSACTFVDAIHYLVDDAARIGDKTPSQAPAKYRAQLVGVAVGGTVRPVAPAAEVFFATPEPLQGIGPERQL